MSKQRLARVVSVPALVLLLPAAASGQICARLSISSNGFEGNGPSYGPRMSEDGWTIAWSSDATNLDVNANDTNDSTDVFLHDRWTGTTRRISVDASGNEADGPSWVTWMSWDGRYVGIFSAATNLVPGDTNGKEDCFSIDTQTGEVVRISEDANGVEGNDHSSYPSCSGDGKIWAFESYASNWDSSGVSGFSAIYLKNLNDDSLQCVSVSNTGAEGNGDSFGPDVSREGDHVAYSSFASNLVTSDANATVDCFLYERSSATTWCLSVDAFGATGNGASINSKVSWNGKSAIFETYATNLFGVSDTNGLVDVAHRDLESGTTDCVSADTAGAPGNGVSFIGAISGRDPTGSGKVGVAFTSSATNLDPDDTVPQLDVYYRNIDDGKTSLISRNASGTGGDRNSFAAGITPDQQYVLFESIATDLVTGDTNGVSDVFGAYRAAAEVYEYGCGFGGTLGVPTLTASGPPVVGETLSVTLSNSAAAQTAALLMLGFGRDEIEFPWGAKLLVDSPVFIPVVLPVDGFTFSGDLPDDTALDGFYFNLQAIQVDPGAIRKMSFTRGTEFRIGIYL